jgi:hypothetical protein
MAFTTYNYNKFKDTNVCGDFNNVDALSAFGGTITKQANATFQRKLTAGSIISNSSVSSATGFNCNSSGENNETAIIANHGTTILYNRDAGNGKTYFINQRGR